MLPPGVSRIPFNVNRIPANPINSSRYENPEIQNVKPIETQQTANA